LGLGWHPRDALRAAGAGALFLGLCGYAFVSTRALAAPDASSVALQTLLPVVRSMFPGVLKPLSPLAGSASDLQPGWSVLAALIAGALGAFATRSRPTLALSIVALLLLCLSLPVPLATAALWRAVPQAVLDMTNAFPAQRLFPVLAAGAVVLCASALAAARWRRRWVVPGLLAAVAWSGFELGHMVHRGALIANSRATSDELMAQCNLITTTFATTLLPSISAFFSYGFTDYELEQRILDDPKGSYIATNAGAIAPGFDFNSAPVQRPLHGQLVGTPAANGRQWIDLNPALILAPHRHYLLALEFTGGPYAGVLQIKGSALSHEYYLPDSGGRFAFGSGPVNAHVTPLWNPTDTPMELRLDFVVQDPAGDLARFRDFARYELIPYEPGDLPIQLKSFAPYAARVRSASAGWLETFRYNLPGWTAIVNGRPSPVRQTPNGLIAVPIPAGESEVMLAYRPPAVLRACYWVTAACWFGFVAAWAARALRR
jgi:hypothetical protein